MDEATFVLFLLFLFILFAHLLELVDGLHEVFESLHLADVFTDRLPNFWKGILLEMYKMNLKKRELL